MFSLINPWVLLFFPLPLLIWYLLKPQNTAFFALKIPFYERLQSIINKEKYHSLSLRQIWLLYISWLLLLFALARPVWVGLPQNITNAGRNILLALDISGSMEIPDMQVNNQLLRRIDVVKNAAMRFVKQRQGDQLGLILFGTRAYLMTPLTSDREAVLNRIEDATVGLAGGTTSIGDALGLAVKRLQQTPKNGRIIILLTDGSNNSGLLNPLKAAELAKMDDIKIYTIGLGGGNYTQFPSMLLAQMQADLDEETLQKIAQLTGGKYFRATDPSSLSQVYENINKIETIKHQQLDLRPRHEYYPWPGALALLILLLWLLKNINVSNLTIKKEPISL